MAPDYVGACIERARLMIERVETAVEDLDGPDLDRANTAAFLIGVYGHATTQILHNLKSVYDRDAVEKWWAPWQAAMRKDPMLRFLWNMRSSFLKEGVIGGPGMVGEPQDDPPPYWRWRFIVGSSWIIDHLGATLTNPGVDEMGRLYVAYLRRILVSAMDEFHGGVPFDHLAGVRVLPRPAPSGTNS